MSHAVIESNVPGIQYVSLTILRLFPGWTQETWMQ